MATGSTAQKSQTSLFTTSSGLAQAIVLPAVLKKKFSISTCIHSDEASGSSGSRLRSFITVFGVIQLGFHCESLPISLIFSGKPRVRTGPCDSMQFPRSAEFMLGEQVGWVKMRTPT